MITGDLRNKIDKIWETFWTGGIANTLYVIEQFTYLLFIKQLEKEGFYQYSAAWDSKHKVTLEGGKSDRVLFELQEMTDGGAAVWILTWKRVMIIPLTRRPQPCSNISMKL